MKPVDQTILSHPEGIVRGNCMTACVASLFEMSIEEVPYWAGMPVNEWFDSFDVFLHEHGYQYSGLFQFNKRGDWNKLLEVSPGVNGYFMCSGPSWREYVVDGHAVIYKDGILVHDPHFSKMGIKVLEDAWMIEPIGTP